jgi:hypothetical protein
MKLTEKVIGVEIFDGSIIDGHWRKLSLWTGLAYLIVCLDNFKFGYHDTYYDMIHKSIRIGFLHISWGTMRGADKRFK